MREYCLKKEVTNTQLMSYGFNIITAGNDTIAVKNVDAASSTIIIYLKPPKRIVQWRFASMANVPVDPYIQDFIELLDIDNTVSEGLMTIAEWSKEIHKNAVNKGFWEKEPVFGDVCSLITTEVSEAYEEYRGTNKMFYISETGKPEGIAVELVDVVLRVFDYLEAQGIDIEKTMKLKHEYNKTRAYKHGGKRV